ncbi:MAG: hypothetical protein ACI4XJ_03050 [Eubacteriales bacterium]
MIYLISAISYIYSAIVNFIPAPLTSLLTSPATGDKIGGIVTMLCISGVALVALIVLTLIIKRRKK